MVENDSWLKMIRVKKIDYNASITKREKFISEITEKFPEKYIYLQTCNRAELYFGNGEFSKEVLTHLCRVISGLESKITGETNIHGQVKKAYFDAIENDHSSPGLNKLFQTAFKIAKKVRAESGITGTIVSHSRACIELLKSIEKDFTKKKIIIIGAHHTNKKIIRLLSSTNCEKIFITNRTDEKAELFSKDFECNFLPYSELKNEIKNVDILISAVRAKQPILFSDDLPEKKDFIAIDLSVPRNIHLDSKPKIKYFDIEDVEKFIHCEVNRNKIKKAEEIIETLINLKFNHIRHIRKHKK